MQSLSEIRMKHARRIAYHVVRIRKNISLNEEQLIEYLLAGGSLEEILNNKYAQIVLSNCSLQVSAASISIAVDDPSNFIELFARALANTCEAELFKNGMGLQ